MEENETDRRGVLSVLRSAASTVLRTAENRLELLLVELHEERINLINVILLTALVVALGWFTVALAALTTAIVIWNEFGVTGLLIMVGVGVVATLASFWCLRCRLKSWRFLSATLGELKKDRQWLESKN
jgi:uncharacterized membrane protein YqjE